MANVFDTALSRLLTTPIGSEATYTPSGGGAVPGIYINIELSTEVQSADTAGRAVIMPTIEYIINDLGGEVAEGDTFLITGVDSPGYGNTYSVCERVSYDGKTAMVTVK